MSNRTNRKFRHRSDKGPALTFKQHVQLGVAHARLVRGEINYNDIPQWMRDISKSAKQEAELTEAVQETIDETIEASEHVHGEGCTHHV